MSVLDGNLDLVYSTTFSTMLLGIRKAEAIALACHSIQSRSSHRRCSFCAILLPSVRHCIIATLGSSNMDI